MCRPGPPNLDSSTREGNTNGKMSCYYHCTKLDLAITNTFFHVPDKWYHSWTHPRSKRPHLLDYILVRRSDVRDVCITHAMRGADCSTDHLLIHSKLAVCLHVPRHRSAPKPSHKLDVSVLHSTDTRQQLQAAITNALVSFSQEWLNNTPVINEIWNSFSTAVYNAMQQTLGKVYHKQLIGSMTMMQKSTSGWEMDEKFMSLSSAMPPLLQKTAMPEPELLFNARSGRWKTPSRIRKLKP